MKILLIKPPIIDFYRTSIRTQPIGLAYLAASLMGHGYEVEILDCQTYKKKTVTIPAELSYISEYYPFYDISPFKLYSGFYHFGMEWDEISRAIKNSQADIFGISSLFTPYHGEALMIAGIIKEWDAGKIVVMGGAHVSCDPEGTMKDTRIDYVVLGEGEARFPLLLEKIAENRKNDIREIDGIGFRENGEVLINPVRSFEEDPNAIAYPARELLDIARYAINRKPSTMLITSRGCPHKCAYCSAHLVMGSKFRPRSPEAVLSEIKYCHEKFGIRCFDFEDDNFTFEKRRAKDLLNLIIAAFGERGLELSAMNGISFASLDNELLGLMEKAGFSAVNLSFVSSDVITKEKMMRPKAAVEFNEIVDEANLLGMQVVAYGIFGMPGQTLEEMTETVIALAGKRVLIGPSIYYPTPGTPLFARCEREGLLPHSISAWRSSAFPVQTKEFSRLDLVTLFRLTRAVNFIKAKMVQGELPDGSTLANIIQEIKNSISLNGESCDKLSLSGINKNNIWKYLLLLLFEQKSFYSVRKTKDKGIEALKEKTSITVLEYFFDKSWDMPIRKS